MLSFYVLIIFQFNSNANLGLLIQTIIKEFERFPPMLPLATPNLMSSKSFDSYADNKMVEDSLISNLSSLSLEELKQLDTDPEFFDDFIEEMSVVQHLNEELDSMINQVEIIASM